MKRGPAIVFVAALLATLGPADAACTEIKGLSQLLAKPTLRIVVVGELHGTTEMPAAFGDIVCAAAASGKTVAVGVEAPVSDQPMYDAYFASRGTAEDREKILNSPTWRNGMDGRDSAAMFALIERVRVLAHSGNHVSLFAFQPVLKDPGQSFDPASYEAAMAANIAGRSTGDSLVLALVGNVHALKTQEPHPGFSMPYRPMAMHLPAAGVFSVLLTSSGGDAWNCIPSASGGFDPSLCGPHPQSPSARFDAAPGSGVTLFGGPQGGYDAILSLERVTASPPASAKH